MTEAEEVIEALVGFKCGDKVWNTMLADHATILRQYDPFMHLVESYEHGCYVQRLWWTANIRHVDF